MTGFLFDSFSQSFQGKTTLEIPLVFKVLIFELIITDFGYEFIYSLIIKIMVP